MHSPFSPVGTKASVRPRAVWGWILFDCAAQPFFTLVTTFIFAPYFAAHLAPSPAEGQALWGYATAAAGLIIALTAPLLGAIADLDGRRKPWIALFGALMMMGSAALWFAAPSADGAIPLALIAFALATIGAEYATVFNNAMMPALVPAERLGRLSGTGWAIGYAGGLLSLFIMLFFLAGNVQTGKTLLGLSPALGLDPAAHEGSRFSGPFAALWFLVFALPLFLFTPDAPKGLGLRDAARAGTRRFAATLADLRKDRQTALFLLANMLYTDGLISLFAFGGIYAAGIFGWTATEAGVFGILITLAGVVGAVLGGRLDDALGPKTVVLGALTLLTLATLMLISLDRNTLFFFSIAPAPLAEGLFASLPEKVFLCIGALIGLAAGPVQAASRTLLCRLAPQERLGQYFGLFALTGKITSFMGPFAVALLTDVTDSQQMGVVPLVALFLMGGLILTRVREGPSRRKLNAGNAASR